MLTLLHKRERENNSLHFSFALEQFLPEYRLENNGNVRAPAAFARLNVPLFEHIFLTKLPSIFPPLIRKHSE